MQTDWTAYYSKPYKSASWSRKVTGKIIINLLQKYNVKNPSIIEIGGGNSCFFEAIYTSFNPSHYIVLDYNQLGVDLFNSSHSQEYDKHAIKESRDVYALKWDALNPDFSIKKEHTNLVMSFGLIEHFSQNETAQIIKTHFDLIEKGGLVLMTFPTPSFSYKLIRFFAELFNQWIFTDERALKMNEVINECKKHSDILEMFFNHKILLSQGIVLCRKR